MSKPIASISLDLDNQWAYMKNHGTAGWESYPSYFDIFVPKILDELNDFQLKITFFIVGKDALLNSNQKHLKSIVDDGHEIANHSFNHDTWLHRYTVSELEEEISNAHEAIFKATGIAPLGFRGPGFTWNEDLLDILAAKGYTYDASTFPTFIGPLLRRVYYKTSKLSKEERKERKDLFGKFSDGFRPLKPFIWKLKNGLSLFEIPVTTMPFFRTPVHLTYLVYLASISTTLMMLYLKCSLLLYKTFKVNPSFLIHPLDLMGNDMVSGFETFPGMNLSSEKKIRIFRKVIKLLDKYFLLVPMNVHVASELKKRKSEEKSKPADYGFVNLKKLK